MKRCPTCSRTYASDDFSFCLEDGSLLSASYDPHQAEPAPPKRNHVAPPTEVLPHGLDPTVPAPPADVNAPIIPTMAVPRHVPMQPPPQVNPIVFGKLDNPPRRSRSRLIFVAIPVLLLFLVFGGLFIYASQCPAFTITCSPGKDLTGCVVSDQSFFQLGKFSWQTSLGTIVRVYDNQGVVIDTTSVARPAVITVTATYHSWLCSTNASRQFVPQ